MSGVGRPSAPPIARVVRRPVLLPAEPRSRRGRGATRAKPSRAVRTVRLRSTAQVSAAAARRAQEVDGSTSIWVSLRQLRFEDAKQCGGKVSSPLLSCLGDHPKDSRVCMLPTMTDRKTGPACPSRFPGTAASGGRGCGLASTTAGDGRRAGQGRARCPGPNLILFITDQEGADVLGGRKRGATRDRQRLKDHGLSFEKRSRSRWRGAARVLHGMFPRGGHQPSTGGPRYRRRAAPCPSTSRTCQSCWARRLPGSTTGWISKGSEGQASFADLARYGFRRLERTGLSAATPARRLRRRLPRPRQHRERQAVDSCGTRRTRRTPPFALIVRGQPGRIPLGTSVGPAPRRLRH